MQRVWVCLEYARLKFQNAAEFGGWLGRWGFPALTKSTISTSYATFLREETQWF